MTDNRAGRRNGDTWWEGNYLRAFRGGYEISIGPGFDTHEITRAEIGTVYRGMECVNDWYDPQTWYDAP